MKFLVTVSLPVEAGNAMVKEPGFSEKMQGILVHQKAESVYFGLRNGQRTAFYVTDVADASKLPSISEPWWLWTKAAVECIPVMTPQDLGKASTDIAACVKKFG